MTDTEQGRPSPGDLLAEQGVALVRERSGLVPVVAVVLGSGLGEAIRSHDALVADHEFSFETLPGFPSASVPGQAGRLVLGKLFGVPAAVFFGRIHVYEGHGVAATTLIPRLAAGLGARTMILTNAAGGLRPEMRPGHLMLLRDHMNRMGMDPLTGWRFADGSPAFVDLGRVYEPELIDLAGRAAAQAGIEVLSGVYVAHAGPSYETPAENAAVRIQGGDAVGMSTVPEAVAAAALGMSVLGISCITNIAGAKLAHGDVLEVGRRASRDLATILAGVVPALDAIA